jgi:hypothetical protein
MSMLVGFMTTVIIFGCSPPESYEEISTTISGRISDAINADGLGNVTIRTEPPSQQVTTNNDGYYYIETNVTVGESYVVFANKTGYLENKANVTVREGDNTSVDIQLERTGAILSVDNSTLNFGARKTSLPLTIINQGGGVLNYNINDGSAEDWLIIEGELSGSVSDVAATVNLSVNRTGLNDGTSSTQFTINSNGGNQTIIVNVDKLGENDPRISITPDELNFTSDIDELSVNIENLGTGILTWSFTEKPVWLSVVPESGDTSAEIDTVTFRLDRSVLGSDTSGVVKVESNHTTIQLPIRVNGSGVVDPMPDPDPMTPVVFMEGEIRSRVPSPTTTGCGLAYQNDSLWLGDCDSTELLQVGLDGALRARYDLPIREDVKDLTALPNGIMVLFETGGLWLFDTSSSTFVEADVASGVNGIAFDGEFLCTWQGNSVYRRDPLDYSIQTRAIASESKGQFAYGSRKFFTKNGVTMDGLYFQFSLEVFKADSPTSVRSESSFILPIDASIVSGIAANNSTVWVIARGVGEDAGKFIEIGVR